jgi:hypothetical protein
MYVGSARLIGYIAGSMKNPFEKTKTENVKKKHTQKGG